MTLQTIDIPDSIKDLPHAREAAGLIDLANDRIETFMLANDRVTENFVPCDFHLLDQSLTWITQNNLLTGRRFCEFGSGFGVATLLAAVQQMDSVGIEIDSDLVDQSIDLCHAVGSTESVDLTANFYCGSFIPRNTHGILELAKDMEHVDTHQGDVYQEIGLALEDFDLFFAFPWPGEHHFFEAVFQAGAATNALLLTYRGRDGMHLIRKT